MCFNLTVPSKEGEANKLVYCSFRHIKQIIGLFSSVCMGVKHTYDTVQHMLTQTPTHSVHFTASRGV